MAESSRAAGTGPRFYRAVDGFHPHRPLLRHRVASKLLGGTMFFWIFYRAYHDGPVVLGLRHPWDGHHGHAEHGHGEEHH